MPKIKGNKGFIFIELIVSISIISIVTIALLSLKALSIKNSVDSRLRTNTVCTAQSFMEWFKYINPAVRDSVTYYIFYKDGDRLSKYPDRDYLKYSGVNGDGFREINNNSCIKSSDEYDYLVKVVLYDMIEVTSIHITAWSRISGEDSRVQLVSLRGK